MALLLNDKHECIKKFSVGKDAMAVYVSEGDVAVVRRIRGLNMFYIKKRYLTDLSYGKYFVSCKKIEKDDELYGYKQ